MKYCAIFISVLLLIPAIFRGTIVPESAGQTQGAARKTPPGSGYKIRVDVNTMFLNVLVRDGYNRCIAHLQKEDFQLYEDEPKRELAADSHTSEKSPRCCCSRAQGVLRHGAIIGHLLE
jgi:hypothetical protein